MVLEVELAFEAPLGGVCPLWLGCGHASLPLPSQHVVSKSLRRHAGGCGAQGGRGGPCSPCETRGTRVEPKAFACRAMAVTWRSRDWAA